MTASLLMFVTITMIGFSLAMYTYHFLSSAAQQGVRFAMVRGDTWSEDEATNCSTSAPPSFTMVYSCTASATDVQNYVQSLASGGINASSVTVDTTSSFMWPGSTPDGGTCSTTNAQGCFVKVKVSYTFHFFPYQKLGTWSMNATAEGVILQ